MIRHPELRIPVIRRENDALFSGEPPAICLEDSLANLKVLDGVGRAMRSTRFISLLR